MSSHGHDLGGAAWPFVVPEHTAVLLCPEVFSGASPILWVVHTHDGDWQFLCGGDHANTGPRVACFGCAVQRDSSILALADLPQGWGAERSAPGGAWIRERVAPLEEDSAS
jgi:hypothetical protein